MTHKHDINTYLYIYFCAKFMETTIAHAQNGESNMVAASR